MIQAYKRESTRYGYNGDMALLPEKCVLKAELNGAWALELTHPIDEDGRWRYLEEEAVICAPIFQGKKQLFRISRIEKGDDGISATAYPVFFDSADDHFLMLVVLDSILNRITQNRAKGRNTFIFIDEIYLLFQHEYSTNFLFTLWKRVRKYGAYCTGIPQNVDDLLQSHTARTMLANSGFIIMLNQASTDRIELAKLLNISDLQMSYITNVGSGQGLLKVGSSFVPFVNKFPRNTELYKLMTTKFGEV